MVQALIIEDKADNTNVITHVLGQFRIPFIVAPNAEEALSMLEQEKPALIITDLALPGMDGWDLLQIVRSTPATAKIPVIAMTAYHSRNIAQFALKTGFDAYLPKPIEAAAFERELRRLLNGGL